MNSATDSSDPLLPMRSIEELDYISLLRFLSLPSEAPAALPLRNLLLNPVILQRRPARATPQVQVSGEAARLGWADYFASTPRSHIAAFGDVPPCVLHAGQQQASELGCSAEPAATRRRWGIVRVAASSSRALRDASGALVQCGTDSRQGTATIWLSTELSLSRSGIGAPGAKGRTLHELADAGDEDARWTIATLRALLNSCDGHVPQALARIVAPDAATGARACTLSGINCAAEEVVDDLLAEGLLLRKTFSDPCLHYLKRVSPATGEEPIPPKAGWTVDAVQERDLPLVKARNKIDFSLEYLRHCAHVSVLLRRAPEEPVGWCLMHEHGSLASFWVEPAYRGIGAERPAVLIERLIVRRVARAQSEALRWLFGAEHELDGTIIVTAWTERENARGVKFFQGNGYEAAQAGGTWIGLMYSASSNDS